MKPATRPLSPFVQAGLVAIAAIVAFTSQPVPNQSRVTGRATSPATSGTGRTADAPSKIPARGWKEIAKRVFKDISAHRLMAEGAGITFYSLLALFPAIAALVSIYGLFADPTTIEKTLSGLSGVIPGGGMAIISGQVHSLAAKPAGTLGFALIFGLATALWSSNQGTKSVFDALNVVFGETEKRSFFHLTWLSLAVTAGAIFFLLLAMAGMVVLPVLLNFIGLGDELKLLARIAPWPLLLGGMTLMLAVLYRYGPSRERKAKWRWVSWGGFIASLGWIVVSVGFSAYVSSFGNYDKTYGSLGAAIGFMTWIWLSSIVVLIGAEIDAEMESQTASDTTEGPEKPAGQRGAKVADTVKP